MLTIASISLFILFLTGLWMGAVLGLAGMIILYFSQGGEKALIVVTMAIWKILYSYPLVALPLFILLGEIFVCLGLSSKVYAAITPLLKRFTGKLLLSNVILCALFSAASGSSMATAAAIGSVAYPELKRKGYDRRTLLGNLAGSGTLGILIPPSIPIIVYGSLTNVSVGASFVAAVVPGIMAVLMVVTFVVVLCKIRPNLVPQDLEDNISLAHAIGALKGLVPMAVLVSAVMGTIYLGVATPTEAGGVGVFVAIMISFAYRTFSVRGIVDSLVGTSLICATIGFVIMGAMIFATSVALTGFPRAFVMTVADLSISPMAVLAIVFLMYFVLGCFMGAIEMLVITLPFTFPLVMSIGYDPLWFAVAVVILCEMGQLTPPFGVNLFVLQGIADDGTTVGDVARGAFPYLLLLGLLLVVITIFPQLCTFLPAKML